MLILFFYWYLDDIFLQKFIHFKILTQNMYVWGKFLLIIRYAFRELIDLQTYTFISFSEKIPILVICMLILFLSCKCTCICKLKFLQYIFAIWHDMHCAIARAKVSGWDMYIVYIKVLSPLPENRPVKISNKY